MKTYNLKLSIKKPFGNLLRERTVNIIIKNSAGKYLLGVKPKFYPPGIVRLIGGGVRKNETSKKAAIREIDEELDVKVRHKDIKEVAEFNISAQDHQGGNYKTVLDLMKCTQCIDKYNAGDDISSVALLNRKDMEGLVKAYESLSKNLWFRGKNGHEFSWSDYGKVYSKVHEIAIS